MDLGASLLGLNLNRSMETEFPKLLDTNPPVVREEDVPQIYYHTNVNEEYAKGLYDPYLKPAYKSTQNTTISEADQLRKAIDLSLELDLISRIAEVKEKSIDEEMEQMQLYMEMEQQRKAFEMTDGFEGWDEDLEYDG